MGSGEGKFQVGTEQDQVIRSTTNSFSVNVLYDDTVILDGSFVARFSSGREKGGGGRGRYCYGGGVYIDSFSI